MKSRAFLIILLGLCFFYLVGLMSCEEPMDEADDSDESEYPQDKADDDDNDDEPMSDDDDDSPLVGGRVLDYVSAEPIMGATVELLDNETGESLSPAVTATSDINGNVLLTVPAGHDQIAVETTAPAYNATRKHYYEVGTTNNVFWGISNIGEAIFASLLGISFDPAKSKFIGEVLWRDSAGTEPVGCAGVTLFPDPGTGFEKAYYFSSANIPSNSREKTNPENGQYLLPDIDPTQHYSVIAVIQDMVEATYIPLFVQDVFVIVDIFFDESEYPANPTPAGCFD